MKARLQLLLAVVLVLVFVGAMLVGPSGCCSHAPELKATTAALAKDIPIFVAHSKPATPEDEAAWKELAELLKANSARLAAEAAK